MISLNLKPIHYYMLAGIFFFIGVLYYAFAHNLVIIRSPFNHEVFEGTHQTTISKKKVTLYFWHNEKWQSEEIDLLWSTDIAQTLQHLISSWLSLIAEEQLQEKQVSLQSIALSAHQQEAYISFDRNPFDKTVAAFDKLVWIEGLLKTIRENNIKLQAVQFLAHHKPLNDYHLDFANPWPLEGFLST